MSDMKIFGQTTAGVPSVSNHQTLSTSLLFFPSGDCYIVACGVLSTDDEGFSEVRYKCGWPGIS